MDRILRLSDAIFCPFGCPDGTTLKPVGTASTTLVAYVNSVNDNCTKLDYRCQGCKGEFTIVCKPARDEACYIDGDQRLLAGRSVCSVCVNE